MNTNHGKGKFISFEGIDGAGKSTHIALVVDRIAARGHEVVTTREPGGTALGEALRTLLLHHPMHLETEALLMFAARRQHLAEVIEPALARGAWVVSDRFSDASFAYQGGGRGLSLEKIAQLEQWVHPHRQPDLTLLFDVPLDVARKRLDATRTLDRFEQEQSEFFGRVRTEYLNRANSYPHRFRVIDATMTILSVGKALEEIIASI